MMNPICWICDINLSFKYYEGSDLLDEDGNKPCQECIFEAEDAKEEEAE